MKSPKNLRLSACFATFAAIGCNKMDPHTTARRGSVDKCSHPNVLIQVRTSSSDGNGTKGNVTVAAIPYGASNAYDVGDAPLGGAVSLCVRPGKYALTATAFGRRPAFEPGLSLAEPKTVDLALGAAGPSIAG